MEVVLFTIILVVLMIVSHYLGYQEGRNQMRKEAAELGYGIFIRYLGLGGNEKKMFVWKQK
jgi:hypothetical protein